MPSNTECDGFDFLGWSIRAASIRGIVHRQFSDPRQDAYAVRYSEAADRIVLAVCDGVGSAQLSHKAARCVADRLSGLALTSGLLPDIDWVELFFRASDEVVDIAAAVSRDVETAADARRIMATTAHVVVIDGLAASGPWHGVSASVGDSTAWKATSVEGPSFDAWEQIAKPTSAEEAEFAGNATSSIPLIDAAGIAVQPIDVDPNGLLIVCSDGVSDAFVGGVGQVPLALGEVWASPPSALNFAAHVGYGRRTQTDDRTCIALWSPT
ncbi:MULTISPECIES: protein phosphatase 2C domain-containing protein [Rhodococcus]|nr:MULTISPECIES: protein phosphatase 2C domain-containing protein [Rhodococcus]